MIPRDDMTGADIIRGYQRFKDLMSVHISDLRCNDFRVYRNRYYFQEVQERARGMECQLFCRYVMEYKGPGSSSNVLGQWLDDVNCRGFSLKVEPERARWPEHVGVLCVYQEKWIVGFGALNSVRDAFQSQGLKRMGRNMLDEGIFI